MERMVSRRLEGSLAALPDMKAWPFKERSTSQYVDFIVASNMSLFTVTGGGLIDGHGIMWWNMAILEGSSFKRPHLVIISDSKDVVVHNVHLHNSPSSPSFSSNRCSAR